MKTIMTFLLALVCIVSTAQTIRTPRLVVDNYTELRKRIRISITDTGTNYIYIPVSAKSAQFDPTHPTTQLVFSNRPYEEELNAARLGLFAYWKNRGGNELARFERFFNENRNDTALVQYNSVIITKNTMTQDTNSLRYDSAVGKMTTLQNGGFSGGNVLYPTFNTIIRPSPFGADGSTFYGTFGFGSGNNFTTTYSPNPIAPIAHAVYTSLISFNDFVPVWRKRVIRGGLGIANYEGWWKSSQNESTPIGTGSSVAKVTTFLSIGGMYVTPVAGLSTKADITSASKVDTAMSFWSVPQYTETNEVINGYGFVQEGIKDINVFQGISQFGTTAWMQKSEKDLYPNRVQHILGSVYIKDSLSLGANPDGINRLKVVGKVTIGSNKTSNLTQLYLPFYDTASSITPSLLSRALHVDREIVLKDSTVMGTSSGLSPLLVQGFYKADSLTSMSSNYQGSILAEAMSFGFRDKVGIGVQNISGSTNWNNTISGVMYKFATEGTTPKNITGYLSALRPIAEFASPGIIDAYSDFVEGSVGGSFGGTITNKYGRYTRTIKEAAVTNAYAWYQEGTADSTVLNGILRLPNVAMQTTYNDFKPTSTLANGTVVSLPGFGGGSYVEKTTTYGIVNNDFTINCTSGSFTVTLPTAAGITGKIFVIKNSGAGSITVATTGGQTSDGVASVAAGTVVQFQSTGTNYIKIN